MRENITTYTILLLVGAVIILYIFQTKTEPTLWVWEGDQDMTFVSADEADFAVLLGYLHENKSGGYRLKKRSGRVLLPEVQKSGVIRIPNNLNTNHASAKKAASAIAKACSDYNQNICQIDFDAKVSERNWYKSLFEHLQDKLPTQTISMTANLSWCTKYDDWINTLRVDHVVPMYFSLGVPDDEFENEYVPDLLLDGVCSQAAGFSRREPKMFDLLPDRLSDDIVDMWMFSPTPWTEEKINSLQTDFKL